MTDSPLASECLFVSHIQIVDLDYNAMPSQGKQKQASSLSEATAADVPRASTASEAVFYIVWSHFCVHTFSSLRFYLAGDMVPPARPPSSPSDATKYQIVFCKYQRQFTC